MTDAPTTRETADHAELARLAEDASSGPWSVDADDTGRTIVASPVEIVARDTRHNSEFIAAFNPATAKSLLSEIAALRARLEMEATSHASAKRQLVVEFNRATQAERQRDEALDAARKLSAAINWTDYPFIDNSTSREELISRLGFMQKDAEQPRAFLANQGADQ